MNVLAGILAWISCVCLYFCAAAVTIVAVKNRQKPKAATRLGVIGLVFLICGTLLLIRVLPR